MDPDATLAEIREILSRGNIFAGDSEWFDQDAVRLAELVQALDEWLSHRQGFLPRAWQHLKRD